MTQLKDILTNHREGFSKMFLFDITEQDILKLDMSVDNISVPVDVYNNTDTLAKHISEELKRQNKKIAVGGYMEDRMIYRKSEHFGDGDDARTIHLGTDIWCDEYTPVRAPLNGKIHSFRNNSTFGDYGPTIILEHSLDDKVFYTLYGHLSAGSINNIETGQYVCSGEVFAELGNNTENGNWPPHLHFQIISDIGDNYGDFPGVCSKKEIKIYKEICPDPLLILKF
ncbi:MAG: peptidoglycan DD-metalloendopeptidase family protein [Bacteroidales bacterium]|jgi:murein DD-endopeptidase MepM/ murein hydrolase activator NlpD|nr:peptidoglycan DD-metalloendopeptidase family protein [Bacteroidales bacterium]